MKTVLITGATENTGLAIAKRFAADGYNIALTSRNKAKAAIAAAEISSQYKCKTAGYAFDFTEQSAVTLFEKVQEDFKELHTLVLNAADLAVDFGILNTTAADFDRICAVNLKGNFICCQQAARLMLKTGGSIVIVGSVHHRETIGGRAVYSLCKGGLYSLSCAMAVELGRYNIRSNYISCGAIRTNRWDALTPQQVAEKRTRYPLGVESTGEDIAQAAFYLGTDLSKTVTGTELTVDSGIGCCLLPYKK